LKVVNAAGWRYRSSGYAYLLFLSYLRRGIATGATVIGGFSNRLTADG
jgi:hypothetical protein